MIPPDVTPVGEHDVELLIRLDGGEVPDEQVGLPMSRDEIPGDDFQEAHVLVEVHVDDEVHPDGLRDLQRFLMAGIPFEDEIVGEGGFQEGGAVEFLDRARVDEPRADGFPAAGAAHHEVALDETRRDADVGVEEDRIHKDVAAGPGLPDVGQRSGIIAVVVDDPVVPADVLAVHVDPFPFRARPVHAVADDDHDMGPDDPRFFEFAENRKKDAVLSLVGNGPRNVGDGDRRRKLPGWFGFLPHDAGDPVAPDRVGKGVGDGALGIFDDGHVPHGQNPAVPGDGDFQGVRPVFDVHGLPAGNIHPADSGSDVLSHRR